MWHRQQLCCEMQSHSWWLLGKKNGFSFPLQSAVLVLPGYSDLKSGSSTPGRLSLLQGERERFSPNPNPFSQVSTWLWKCHKEKMSCPWFQSWPEPYSCSHPKIAFLLQKTERFLPYRDAFPFLTPKKGTPQRTAAKAHYLFHQIFLFRKDTQLEHPHSQWPPHALPLPHAGASPLLKPFYSLKQTLKNKPAQILWDRNHTHHWAQRNRSVTEVSGHLEVRWQYHSSFPILSKITKSLTLRWTHRI